MHTVDVSTENAAFSFLRKGNSEKCFEALPDNLKDISKVVYGADTVRELSATQKRSMARLFFT